jgi:hypothetical protein
MTQKYIIDKTDLHDLLTGKEIPLPQGNKARAFCVEVSGEMTNGEVIQAVFPNISVYEHGSIYSVNNEYNFNATWWNTPYQKDDEE